jgi:polysaccharide biosynthesis transport protein
MPEDFEPEIPISETLKRVTDVLIRGRMWIMLSVFVTTLATVAVLYRLPNRYTSEAVLLVVEQQVPQRYVTPTSTADIANVLQAMTQEVLSRTQLLELIEQFGLYEEERQYLAPEKIIDLMRKYIDIQPLDPVSGRKDFNAFKISFSSNKAVLARDVTSRLTSLFIRANLKTREDQAANTTNFLQERLAAAKKKLTEQEEHLRDFKTQYLGELPEQQQGNLAILNGAQLQLQNITAGMDRAKQQRVYLESLLNGYRRLAARGGPAPGLPGSDAGRAVSPLQAAQNDLARLQSEKARLLTSYRANHPDVIANERAVLAQQALIESLRTSGSPESSVSDSTQTQASKSEMAEDDSSIAQLRSQLEANRVEIENLSKDEKQQKAMIEQYQSRLNLSPVREQQLASVLRDYELSKQDYSDLLGKEQQSELAMSLEKQQGGQQFRLVEPPSLPALPSSPKRIKFSLMGAGGGVFLGLALAFLMDFRSPSFRTAKEASLRLSMPLVIDLPLLYTNSEKRVRTAKVVFEWLSGLTVAAAVVVAEYYVYRHP